MDRNQQALHGPEQNARVGLTCNSGSEPRSGPPAVHQVTPRWVPENVHEVVHLASPDLQTVTLHFRFSHPLLGKQLLFPEAIKAGIAEFGGKNNNEKSGKCDAWDRYSPAGPHRGLAREQNAATRGNE